MNFEDRQKKWVGDVTCIQSDQGHARSYARIYEKSLMSPATKGRDNAAYIEFSCNRCHRDIRMNRGFSVLSKRQGRENDAHERTGRDETGHGSFLGLRLRPYLQ